jgi:aminomethyltransferase
LELTLTFSWRTTALADRHRALGSQLEDWSGMPTAWTYDKDIHEEHVAIRTKAGLMDVSGLKKVHLVGPHSHAVLHQATTRDVTKIYPGKASYACMLDDRGLFTDDCIMYRTGPNSWMVVHGSGSGHEQLTRSALGRNVAVLFDDDLHDLSLQGPLAVDYLAKHVPGIRELPYFHHMATRLFGRPVTISRTGYTGERGYEIFCKAEDAPLIWDTILEDGADLGIIPCRFTVLDMLRVESYLLFYPYDNSEMYPFDDDLPGDSLWELGLDFTVSPGKVGFRGAEAHYGRKGKERFKIFGVLVDGDEPTSEGDLLYAGDRQVGVIACGMYSTLTGRSMAIARLDVDKAVHGTALEVRGASVTGPAAAHTLPFDDPEKKKRTARG